MNKVRLGWLIFLVLLGEFFIIYGPLVLYQQLTSIAWSLALGMGIVIIMLLGTFWGLRHGRIR